MAKKEEKHSGMHKWKPLWLIVLGLLILINSYWPFISWGGFVGGVLLIAGLIKWVIWSN